MSTPAPERTAERRALEQRPALVILDRDGVLNYDSDDYIRTAAEWQPLPGAMWAAGRLARAGMRLAVATNQSGLARGYFDSAELERMHAKLGAALAAEGAALACLEFCPHLPGAGCDCRKPRPGMLLAILHKLNMLPAQAVFVGDNLSDVGAADAAGILPILVLTGKGARLQERGALPPGVPVFADLGAVAEALLALPS